MTRSLCAVVPSPPRADAADIALQPVDFQTIPYDVLTDAAAPRGSEPGRHLHGEGRGGGAGESGLARARWLLADRAGRFWFESAGTTNAAVAVVGIRGPRRVEIERPDPRRGVWEDTTGRVFTFDGQAVHILADGKWISTRHDADGKSGRSARRGSWKTRRAGCGCGSPRERLSGAWAFDGKVDPAHIPGREEAERVRLVLPFQDDWFLAESSRRRTDPNILKFVPFSPSRTAEQVAKAKPFAGLPLDRMGYRGEALDGKRHFCHVGTYTAECGRSTPPWAVAADGVVTR